jgi:hypothetical protein
MGRFFVEHPPDLKTGFENRFLINFYKTENRVLRMV